MRQIRHFELDPNRCVALEPARACVIEPEAGHIWLTVESDPTDHWLGAGERIALASGRRAWVSAPAAGARIRVIDSCSAPSPTFGMVRPRIPRRLHALLRAMAPMLGPSG